MSAVLESKIDRARRHNEQGQLAQCETLCREILEAEPEHVEAWNLLGIAACRQGKRSAGTAAVQRALFLEGGRADIHMNLGNALRESGEAERAEQCFRAALSLEPSYAAAHYNLGLVLEDQGRRDEALGCYAHTLQLDARFARAYLNAGGIFEIQGRDRQAMEAYRSAIRCEPGLVEGWRNIAALLDEEGRLPEAIAHCQHALKLEPENARTLYMLGLLLEAHGSTEHAAMCVRRAIERSDPRKDADMRFTLALMLPPVAQSRAQIGELRSRLERNLGALEAADSTLDQRATTLSPPFFLSYHGECNRELHGKIVRLLERACPALLWTAPHCREWKAPGERIKVGFISRFMRAHSIGKTTRGLVAQLDRSRFEVCALFLPPAADDEVANFIREHAESSIALPSSVPEARERIAELGLDILFYQDIGMEAMSYFLAFARLAPVQCVSFGHPDTTGIANVDYFVSSDLYEPEGAAAHYSERLFLLRNAGTLAYYYRPRLQQPAKGRRQLGVPVEGHLYLCPQTLFKLHPDFDVILGGILRADPSGRVVLLEGKHPQWADLLRARFAQSIPDVAGRVSFIAQLNPADFVNLLAVADVVLDTPHFNGMNTSLEAFAMGTPIVTLPGNYQRGRHTFGMYRRMGIDEAIAADAQDYVRLAVKLGTDRAAREALSAKIAERCGALFEDADVVREFERFFTEALQEAGRRPAQPLPAPVAGSESDARSEIEEGNALA
ncbi:MAG: tetratricopeptide repeat protein, partial [Candidatus Parcubacteria bacterium]|nr:tetratricopeptide repeat protein [Burkholderiales bacterium]